MSIFDEPIKEFRVPQRRRGGQMVAVRSGHRRAIPWRPSSVARPRALVYRLWREKRLYRHLYSMTANS